MKQAYLSFSIETLICNIFVEHELKNKYLPDNLRVTLLCLAKKHDAGANLLVNEEKRKLLLTTEGMVELENHHLATITFIVISSKNHQ